MGRGVGAGQQQDHRDQPFLGSGNSGPDSHEGSGRRAHTHLPSVLSAALPGRCGSRRLPALGRAAGLVAHLRVLSVVPEADQAAWGLEGDLAPGGAVGLSL